MRFRFNLPSLSKAPDAVWLRVVCGSLYVVLRQCSLFGRRSYFLAARPVMLFIRMDSVTSSGGLSAAFAGILRALEPPMKLLTLQKPAVWVFVSSVGEISLTLWWLSVMMNSDVFLCMGIKAIRCAFLSSLILLSCFSYFILSFALASASAACNSMITCFRTLSYTWLSSRCAFSFRLISFGFEPRKFIVCTSWLFWS